MQNISETNNEKMYDIEKKEHINVLLVSIYPDNDLLSWCEDSLAELKLLAETSIGEDAQFSKFYTMTQCREKPDVATYIGYGKAV
ncbi:MAG: hypothetical protein IJC65_03555, partial [Oscillospiraceae bacterium]|nr:hypothetical protein [Oscillospiraceae bacterium]